MEQVNNNTGWREEFSSLFLSNNSADVKKALILKSEKLNQPLYRYRSIKNDEEVAWLIKFMQDGKLYCAHRDDLNDPFEFRAPLSSKAASTYYDDVIPESQKTTFFEQFEKHHPEVPEANLAEMMQSENWYEEAVRYMNRDLPEMYQDLVITKLNADLNAVRMRPLVDGMVNYEAILNTVRVACFTTSHKNLPMWSHYANGHRGVCLKFDTSRLQTSETDNLFPAIYTDELQDAVKYVKSFFDNKRLPPVEMLTYTCIQKLRDWDYEDEWRYVCALDPASAPHGGIEVNFIPPSKIILGIKTEPNVKAELCKIASKEKIEITEMQFTPYGLEEKPRPPTRKP